jgi:hypothetical protein
MSDASFITTANALCCRISHLVRRKMCHAHGQRQNSDSAAAIRALQLQLAALEARTPPDSLCREDCDRGEDDPENNMPIFAAPSGFALRASARHQSQLTAEGLVAPVRFEFAVLG